jgi:chromosome segregation ATPase
LAAIDALGQNQRDLTERVTSVETKLGTVETKLGAVETKLDDTGARMRPIEDGMAEVKDLLVRALDR